MGLIDHTYYKDDYTCSDFRGVYQCLSRSWDSPIDSTGSSVPSVTWEGSGTGSCPDLECIDSSRPISPKEASRTITSRSCERPAGVLEVGMVELRDGGFAT